MTANEAARPPDETRAADDGQRSLADLHGAPGHLFRRARQFHDALWLQVVGDSLTPLQYAVLIALEAEPELSQRSLGERIALDKSTIGDLVARLARRGFVTRRPDPDDARRRILLMTEAGRMALYRARPAVVELGTRILAPLEPDERRELIRLLDRLVFSETALTATANSRHGKGHGSRHTPLHSD
ncbi:MAG: MarR family transcriptional regulator [Pseudonocardiaceae bacterium]|nr:MarR family transcriptional regulator [Pseudonocardiaceae bacterium]